MTLQDAINVLADGIAFAEGFYVEGSRADRNNNPGNITIDLTGKSIGRDGMFIVYATAEDGWEALKKQVSMILTNASHIYNSEMTIAEIAARYTTTQQMEWARNVASRVGISVDTKVSTLLTTVTTGIGAGVLIVFAFLWILMRKDK